MPTPEEAKRQAWDIMAKGLGLDPFQRIAANTILDDLEGFEWPPEPGSEHERKLMELGAIVTGQRGSL